ncbi:hypothetical protein WJR50_19865 [Catalinimonas sp. 4WD22]|uniref:LolA family protein n=1 Tax=Catalinimonas locisalis TaxID=3133978 RepID=UPI003100C997
MIRSFMIFPAVFIVSLLQAQDITLDTILHRHFRAVGGQEHWQQMKTCYAEQSYWAIPIYMPPHKRFLGDQLPKSKKLYYQHPDQYRMNIYREEEPSTAFVVRQSDAKLYSYPAKHEEPLPERMKEVMARDFSLYLFGLTPLILSAYEDKSLAYEGKSEAYEKICYKLVITNGDLLEGRTFIYLDAETYRVHAFAHADDINKHKIYENYRSVDGLMLAHKISSYHQGERYEEYTIDKIEINQPLPPNLFTVW